MSKVTYETAKMINPILVFQNIAVGRDEDDVIIVICI